MSLRLEFQRNLYVACYAVFVCGVLAMSAYTLFLLRGDAVKRGFEISEMHTRTIEDLLTQNLYNTKLVAASVLILARDTNEAKKHVMDSFSAALMHTPALRSISLLDDRDRIVMSSNPANVGMVVPTDGFPPPDIGQGNLLRFGKPWEGRDFSGGRESSWPMPVPRDAISLVPVTQTIATGGRRMTLLLALNTDFFINRISRQLSVNDGMIDVYLYDGTLLLSSDPEKRQGERFADTVKRLNLAKNEFGFFEQTSPQGRTLLTSFRASRLYPFVAVTRLDRSRALQNWQSQSRTLIAVVALALLAISVLALAYYRRQRQSFLQKVESDRLHRINATVFDFSNEAILIADDESRIISVNPAFLAVSGYAEDKILGRRLTEFFTAESAVAFEDYVFSCQTPKRKGERPRCDATEGQLVCANGQVLLWMEILSTPEHDAYGEIVGYHRICRNVTERKKMEDVAFFDPLTSLPNHRLFGDRFNQALVACKRNGGYGALIFLDLDNFKPLNDAYGHAVGDLLLIEVTHRIRACVREVDTVARFGGTSSSCCWRRLATVISRRNHKRRLSPRKFFRC